MMLAVGGALVAAWLVLAPLPIASELLGAQQVEIERLNKAADGALVHGLSVAMATGDYGEVQTELSQFHALGYFGAAAVVNERGRVVALDGPLPGVRIGEPLPLPLAGAPRTLRLALGSQPYGQFVLTPLAAASRAAAVAEQPVQAQSAVAEIRWSAGLVMLACAMAAGLLAWRPRAAL
jgi:hypothetical protein